MKILLMGGGKMGQAMLGGWIASGVAATDIYVVEPQDTQRSSIENTFAVTCVSVLSEISASFVPTIIVLAVKPQSMDEALTQLKPFAKIDTLFISIAAGKTLSYFAKHLGAGTTVVRAMPNLPAMIRKGVSGVVASPTVSPQQLQQAMQLMGAVGSVHVLENESDMDALTAISGSGPAYVFAFMEGLIKAGMKEGLGEELAKQLVFETFEGSLALAQASDTSLGQMIKNVASPGGTTQAALDVFGASNRLNAMLDEAVTAATARSKKLSN